ncbi:MAG: threonine synthase, partial [Bacteroidaceae bacterium]|nr:threonine synthase [Bacteroidaceae bacterium]
MKYYSTNHKSDDVTLRDAVVRGLAPDRGLYMPERLNKLSKEFFDSIDKMTFQEMSFEVAKAFFGEDIPADDLKKIVYDTLAFPTPVVKVDDNIYSL